MRFSKKEKEVYIYDGHIPAETIRWYEQNVRSEKMPYDECDVDYFFRHCNVSTEQLFWVEVASAPKITTYVMTNEQGQKKKLSRDAVVGWLGMVYMLNWGKYLEMLAQSALQGHSSTVIRFKDDKGQDRAYTIDFTTKFPKR